MLAFGDRVASARSKPLTEPTQLVVRRIVLLLSLLAIAPGCAMFHRHPPAVCAPEACPSPPVHRLAEVAFDNRSLIQIYSWPIQQVGIPFTATQDEKLRDLTIDQCEEFAARSSPIANQLEAEKSVLCQACIASPLLLQLLELQAAHQRNESAGQAMRAYLALVDVHLQHRLIEESRATIERAQQTIEALRSEGVAVTTDDGQLIRQRLEVDVQAERLRLQSQQLNGQLDTLLNLDRSQAGVIWTNYRYVLDTPELDLANETATAVYNRKDLAALNLLAGADLREEGLDTLRAALRGTSPLMGIMARQIGLLPSHRSRRQDEAEAAGRQCQIEQLAVSKRQAIEMEVGDAVYSVQSRLRVIELQRQSIASLEQSLAGAEQAKDFAPIDLAQDLERRLELIRLQSDLIHEIMGFESDMIRLRQAQGILGSPRSAGSLTQR